MKNFFWNGFAVDGMTSKGLKFITTYKTRHRQSDKIRLFDSRRMMSNPRPITLRGD